jgi:hypothetical protein
MQHSFWIRLVLNLLVGVWGILSELLRIWIHNLIDGVNVSSFEWLGVDSLLALKILKFNVIVVKVLNDWDAACCSRLIITDYHWWWDLTFVVASMVWQCRHWPIACDWSISELWFYALIQTLKSDSGRQLPTCIIVCGVFLDDPRSDISSHISVLQIRLVNCICDLRQLAWVLSQNSVVLTCIVVCLRLFTWTQLLCSIYYKIIGLRLHSGGIIQATLNRRIEVLLLHLFLLSIIAFMVSVGQLIHILNRCLQFISLVII